MVRQKIGIKVRGDFGANTLARKVFGPGSAEHFRHVRGHGDGIDFAPRSRPVTQDDKLDGKAVLVSEDERVHTARVGCEHALRIGVELQHRPFAHLPQAQRAVFHIGPERPLAENLSEFSLRQPAAQIHLPQAVLRGHITLREEEVVDRLRADVRNATRIAQNLDTTGEPGQSAGPFELR